MACPVCSGERIPQDCSVIEKRGKRVIVQGRVYAIIDTEGLTKANYSPFAKYLTVSLYPRKGRVKYLKFKTQQELDRWSFEKDNSFIVHGCLHVADGKELVFDVTQVEPVSS
ncbi:MAG TPA: ricin-type beta-trefoil lectin domain protein [Dehalococcoidia bacterium]|nr:ricin-type beta-trefoil lectin domain protein [Dehalococcoidia bacterium]